MGKNNIHDPSLIVVTSQFFWYRFPCSDIPANLILHCKNIVIQDLHFFYANKFIQIFFDFFSDVGELLLPYSAAFIYLPIVVDIPDQI
jgi:hypothetical protein